MGADCVCGYCDVAYNCSGAGKENIILSHCQMASCDLFH